MSTGSFVSSPGGKRAIDDFARSFFGGRDGDYGELTYRFEDVVATLNGIQPQDSSTGAKRT